MPGSLRRWPWAVKVDTSTGLVGEFAYAHKTPIGLRNLSRKSESTASLADFSGDDLQGDLNPDWDDAMATWEELDWGESEDAKTIDKIMRLKRDDRQDYNKYVANVIDAKRYYVFVSPMQNRARTLRHKSDRRLYITKYNDAGKRAREMKGCMALRTSRTSKVSRQTPGGRKKRAEERQKRRIRFGHPLFTLISNIFGMLNLPSFRI